MSHIIITIDKLDSPLNLARESVNQRQTFRMGDKHFMFVGYESSRKDMAHVEAIEIYHEEKPEWTEDGKPSAGTFCQYQHAHHCGVWYDGTVLYISGEYTIVKGHPVGEQHYYTRNLRFRPIRTPEQIAAEARQQKIEAMAELLSRNTECPSPYVWELAQKAIDLGYIRKEEP